MGETLGKVWYGGYGSNLRRARMDTYLLGGSVPGSRRHNPGTRARSPATAVVTCRIPGRLRFAGAFTVWGTGGGAAFYEPRPGDQSVWCRAYEITVGQLVDVVLQENGVDPRACPATTRRIEHTVAAFLLTTDGAVDLADHGMDTYDWLVRVPAVASGGAAGALDVVVLSRGEPLPDAPPPPVYRAAILQGLREDVGLSASEAEDYLEAFGG